MTWRIYLEDNLGLLKTPGEGPKFRLLRKLCEKFLFQTCYTSVACDALHTLWRAKASQSAKLKECKVWTRRFVAQANNWVAAYVRCRDKKLWRPSNKQAQTQWLSNVK